MRAFQELYERHYPDVYRFALFLTGDRGQAEDLAADTFVRALIARDRINLATVLSYLLTIAKNLHRDHLRRRRLLTPLQESVADPRPAVDVQVHHALRLEHVRARLRQVAR